MIKKQIRKHFIKTGFDPLNKINIYDKKVVREINYLEYCAYRKILFKLNKLVRAKLLIKFKLSKKSISAQRLPIIYPYEWSEAGFFDALKLHVNIFQKSFSSGLLLKDFLLTNILFEKENPVFTDLGSFIDLKKIINKRQTIEVLITSMMIPYAFLPALAFSMNQNKIARDWLSNRFCNTSSTPPDLNELVNGKNQIQIIILKLSIKYWIKVLKLLPLSILFNILNKIFFQFEAKTSPSAYSAYYSDKKKCLTKTPKDKSIEKCLAKTLPKSVVDLGANTGKYSFLAARTASIVYAIEEDEYCANIIYKHSQKIKTPVFAIVKKFEDLHETIFANKELYGLRKNPVLFFPFCKRVKADLVLCLGLIHHLCLGRGIETSKIIETLNYLSTKYCIIEFIDKRDRLITAEKTFFPLYNKMLGNYSEKIFLSEVKRFFNINNIFPSDADTRKIYLLSKK